MSSLDQLRVRMEVDEFYATEARRLDRDDLRGWLDMLTDDVRYVVPLRVNADDPESARRDLTATFDDDRTGIELRIRRFETGLAWTTKPRPRTRRRDRWLLAHRVVHLDQSTLLAGELSIFI